MGHLLARHLDDACAFHTGDGGHRRADWVFALDHIQVRGIDWRGQHPDAHLIDLDLGQFLLLHARHRRRVAMLVINNRADTAHRFVLNLFLLS